MAKATSPSNDQSAAKDGTIHVKVLRARNLPTMDFGKRQDPFGTAAVLLGLASRGNIRSY